MSDAEARTLEAQALIAEAERLMQGAEGWLRRLCHLSDLSHEYIRLVRKGSRLPSEASLLKLQNAVAKLRATLAE